MSDILFTVLITAASSACVVGESAPVLFEGDDVQSITGMVIDYTTGEPIAAYGLETIGLLPERTVLSNELGGFALEVPVASSLFIRTEATDIYRPTISPVRDSANATIPAVSRVDARRQHVSAGVDVLPNTTMVIVEVFPVEDKLSAFSRSNVSIIEPATQALIASEPLVVGIEGDVDPSLDESAPGSSALFVFLNVPVGTFSVMVSCADCSPSFDGAQTVISGGGVTIAQIILGAIQLPPPDSFASIAPLFYRASEGGLGCVNCHTLGGTAPNLDQPPDVVRDALLAQPGVVVVATPETSLLLSKPLFEAPANHPNASFLSADEPGYQAIRAWIANGAN